MSARRIGSIMGSKKSGKQKGSLKALKPKWSKFALVLMICICAVIVGTGGWLFYNQSGMRTDPKPETSNAQNFKKEVANPLSPGNFRNLVGRWIRPDGGYIIEISNVDSNGLLEAAYFNPQPINVSQARLTVVNKKPQVFIELKDVGYPGATYTLIYLPEQEVLAGLYYQPAVGQSFEVVFVRMNP
jgi:hypothetical protein